MKIHKAGYGFLIKIFIVFSIINILFFYMVPDMLFLKKTVLAFCAIFFLFSVNFFIIPLRKPPPDNNIFYAPAAGEIVAIEETEENEFFKEKRVQVSIFMSIWDPHINYIPTNGVVSYFKHHKGKHYVAHRPKASMENEMTSVVINTNNSKAPDIMIRQIAGFVAQRILTYTKPGDKVNQGDEFGFIKFGSRVDLLLPLGINILVKLGEKVKGNKTPIASIDE